MRKFVSIAAVVFITSFCCSCLSLENKKAIQDREKAIAALQLEVADAKKAGSTSTADLESKLKAAISELSTFKTEAKKEAVAKGIGIGESTVNSLAPFLSFLIPGAGGLLALVGSALGGIKSSLAKPA